MVKTIDRRAFVRGAGGAAIALPMLEVMQPRTARGQPARKMRYVVAFAGASPMQSYPPKVLGTGYELTLGLRPLGGRAVMPVTGRPAYTWDSVKDAFTVVSNLRVPSGNVAGAYRGGWHSAVVGPLLSGVSSTGDSTPHPRGITSDQLVANALGAGARFKWLGYRVQPVGYRGNDSRSGIGTISHDGRALVSPIQSPRAAYDQFFRDFSPAGAAPPDGLAALTVKKNRSVMDLVRWNADRLQRRLGKADLARLDEHFTQIREMERRIAQVSEVSPTAVSATCARLPDPGADPGSSVSFRNEYYANRTVGYSDEDKRATIMGDLIYLALACDHARSIAWMFTYPMCFMTVQPIIGNRAVDLHDLGHMGGGYAADMARAVSWHVEHVARLADRLRKTREGTGNLLDRTVIVFLTEGGCVQETHSSDQSCVLVAGGREAGLAQGTHVDGRGRHHANVLVSAMQACGLDVSALGEVKGRIEELHV